MGKVFNCLSGSWNQLVSGNSNIYARYLDKSQYDKVNVIAYTSGSGFVQVIYGHLTNTGSIPLYQLMSGSLIANIYSGSIIDNLVPYIEARFWQTGSTDAKLSYWVFGSS